MPLSEAETKELVAGLVLAWNRACRHYTVEHALPEVDLSLRGRTAGQAVWMESGHRFLRNRPHRTQLKLRLNPEAYRLAPQYVIDTVIPHEVAHLLVRLLYPQKQVKPHGDEWKNVMRECFGIANPSRTHRLSLTRRRQVARPYIYRCACGTHHRFTRIRHNRVGKGRVYFCRSCHEKLQFIGQDEPVR